MTTTTYTVTGMTCDHCVNAVTSEVGAIGGVTAVAVDLVSGGSSTVTVTSDGPLPREEVAAALDEAGEYQIAHVTQLTPGAVHAVNG
jgi:copper chaperone